MAGKGQSRRATPSAQSRGVQARPGDATGMENERLRKENAAAIQEASQSMSLVNPPPVVEQTDQVVDYTEGGNANPGNEETARLITMEEATADGTPVSHYDIPDAQVDMDSLPDGKTDVLPEIVEPNPQQPQPAHGQRRDSQQQVRQQNEPQQPPQPQQRGPVQQREAPVVEQAHRVLRVNTDLEDITIGKDNHFTFRVGVPYKVQKHVYDHLAEKGYVLQ